MNKNTILSLPFAVMAFFAFYHPTMVESLPAALANPSAKATTPKTQIRLVEDNDEAVKAYFLRRKQHDLQWSANTGGRINLDDPEVEEDTADNSKVAKADDPRVRRFVIASKAVRMPDPRMVAHKMGRRSAQYFTNEMMLHDESEAAEAHEEKMAEVKAKAAVEKEKAEEAEHARRMALAAMLMGGRERYFKKTYGYGYTG